jgi:hypothetical protein
MYRRTGIISISEALDSILRRIEILEHTSTNDILNSNIAASTGITADEAQSLVDAAIDSIDVSGSTGDYAPLVHNHALSDITQSGATVGEIPAWNGSQWAPTSPTAATDQRTFPQRIVTSSGGILLSDRLILCEQTGPITLTLPSGASTTDYFNVIDIDGNASTDIITINAGAGTTINGQASIDVDKNYMSVSIGFDGSTRWFIF